MECLFILGRNPALSNAEIASVFGHSLKNLTPETAFLVLDASEEEIIRLFFRLGGSLKVGVVDCAVTHATLEKEFNREISRVLESSEQEKVHLGMSVYGSTSTDTEKISRRVLQQLLLAKASARERGQSVRVVTSRESTLSTVVVKKNHLLDRGREFLIVLPGETDQRSNLGGKRFDLNHPAAFGRGGTSTSSTIAHTIAVQDFEGQSYRDYGRPRRDPRRGILPIQLARIMINLALPTVEAKLRQTVLDPFCGIGTILQEALLLGHNIIGSDIDLRAIEDTKENLNWFATQYSSSDRRSRSDAQGSTLTAKRSNLNRDDHAVHPVLLVSDILALPTKLHDQRIDAIVTELDLGPPIRGALTLKHVEEIRRSLLPLYRDAFRVFAQILKPGRRLVAALPAWRLGNTTHFVVDRLADIIPPTYSLFSIPYTLPQRGTFLYGRPDQHVWREIVVCEKN